MMGLYDLDLSYYLLTANSSFRCTILIRLAIFNLKQEDVDHVANYLLFVLMLFAFSFLF